MAYTCTAHSCVQTVPDALSSGPSTLVSSVAIRGRQIPHPMTDYSIVTLPGRARASATANNVGQDFAPCSMRTAALVNAESPGVLHRALRAATRSDHVLLDRLILRLDLTRRDHYGLFLHLHYSVLRDLEADWSAEDQADFGAMLRCVQSDLHDLRIATPPLSPGGRAALHAHNRLGVAYVLRGSRLGAQFLRRRVPRQYPTAYLDFMPTLSWSQFLAQLETSSDLHRAGHDHEIARGARITFEVCVSVFNRVLSNRSTAYGMRG
jgi:heme oxygenase (biliverdin-IX-beta and delta-forming)